MALAHLTINLDAFTVDDLASRLTALETP